jgi:uncharacterized membrane protein YphA (DoxX/SURF4 family)
MNANKIIPELIILMLVFYFFYEGIYKIAYWSSYSNWLHHAPLIKPFWIPLTYLIPIGEIGLSIALILPRHKIIALYMAISILLIFILWVAGAHVFSKQLFWPFHGFWKNPTWMENILISLTLSWLSFSAIIVSNGGFFLKFIHRPTFDRN